MRDSMYEIRKKLALFERGFKEGEDVIYELSEVLKKSGSADNKIWSDRLDGIIDCQAVGERIENKTGKAQEKQKFLRSQLAEMINEYEHKTLDIIIKLSEVFHELGDKKKKDLAGKLNFIL